MADDVPSGVVFPPRDPGMLVDLGRFLDRHTDRGLLLSPDGERIPLPADVYRLLAEVVATLREGKVVTLVPRAQGLTTQEAADFLGVSRSTLVRLLEDGRIPCDQPGSHPRILFADLLAYLKREHADQRAALDRMTREASEAGMYDDTMEDYAAALKSARKRASRRNDGS